MIAAWAVLLFAVARDLRPCRRNNLLQDLRRGENGQPLHASEMSLVEGEKREVVVKTNRRDEDVLHADILVPADEVVVQVRRAPHDGAIERQDCHDAQEGIFADLFPGPRHAEQELVGGNGRDVAVVCLDGSFDGGSARITPLEKRDQDARV